MWRCCGSWHADLACSETGHTFSLYTIYTLCTKAASHQQVNSNMKIMPLELTPQTAITQIWTSLIRVGTNLKMIRSAHLFLTCQLIRLKECYQILTPSTYIYLHTALCSWPRLPSSLPSDLMSHLVASLAWHLLLSQANIDLSSSWPINLWSPQYLPHCLNCLPICLPWSLQASCTQTYTGRAESTSDKKVSSEFTSYLIRCD